MPEVFDELRERLLRGGIRPSVVQCYVRELSEHAQDATAILRADGMAEQDARLIALTRLGTLDTLAHPVESDPLLRSWASRFPFAVFVLLPLGAMVAGVAALVAGLVAAADRFEALPAWFAPAAIGVPVAVGLVLPVLLGWALTAVALRQRSRALVPLLGIFSIVLFGTALHVAIVLPSESGGGELMVGLGTPSLAHLLLTATLVAIPPFVLPSRFAGAVGARALGSAFALALAPTVSPPAKAATGWFQTPRADGGIIDWHLDRPEGATHHGLIVLAQGTGCTSVEHNDNLALVRSSFPLHAALTVEKRGVAPGDRPPDDQAGCGEKFHANHTKSHRVVDYLAVLDGLRGAEWWNGELVLFGGSEGGEVVARLAAPSRADAAILFVSGGGTRFGEAIELFMQSEMDILGVSEEVRPSINDIYDDIRANPESAELWAGHSYRYWADSMDRRGVDDMLATDASLLMIHAGRDRSVATQTARPVPDIFAEKGRCNLTYWEFPGYDHAMLEADGTSRMRQVLAMAAAWVEAERDDARERDCAQPDFDAGQALGASPISGSAAQTP